MNVPGGHTHWPTAFITFGGGHWFGGGPQFATVGGHTHAPVAGFNTFGGEHCVGGVQFTPAMFGGHTHAPFAVIIFGG
jgi:hypothetical protein